MTDHDRSFLWILKDSVILIFLYAVLTALLFLMLSNWALPFMNRVKPSLFLIPVFYFAIYRPVFLPYFIIFCAGIFLDLMGGMFPVGTQSLSFLFIGFLIAPKRRMLMAQPFSILWLWFSIAVLIDILFKISSILLIQGGGFDVLSVVFSGVMTLLFFPILFSVFSWIEGLVPPGGLFKTS